MIFILRYSKEKYIEMLLQVGAIAEAEEKAKLGEYDPLFKKRLVHPEESPLIKEYNTMILESKNDLSVLHYEIMAASTNLKNLSDNIALRLSNVEQMLLQEKEIRDDMKMLCNAYEEFDTLIVVDDYIRTQSCDYQKGVFKSKIQKSDNVAFKVKEITGNGQEGNDYVLNKDNKFLSEIAPTNATKAFMDSDLQTVYEYQRITIDDSETLYGQYMHKDAVPARCNIVLEAAQTVNECQINGNVFALNGLYFSSDNVSYNNALASPIVLDHSNSIPSTGYHAFPSGKYIKIACESVGNTGDIIAFRTTKGDEKTSESKTRIGIDDTKPTIGDSGYDTSTVIQKISSAKRKVIKLNEIKLMQSVYDNNSYFSTNNLLRYPVQSVAIYADVYVPPHFQEDDYVIFELSVNNKPYTVVPINSSLNGIKIIKTSSLELGAHYSEYIDEPITDVKLTVRFKCPNKNESAVIKHVRLLVGEKYES